MELNPVHHIYEANDELRANIEIHNTFVERFLADIDADNYNKAIGNHGEIYVQVPDLIRCTTCALRHGYPLEEMTEDQCNEFSLDVERCPCDCV